MSKTKKEVDSFRAQMAQSMAELDAIVGAGEDISGGGRFTVRTVRVAKPSAYRPADVRALRGRLGVSQGVFAQLLGVSQVLVRSWEGGVRTPGGTASRLLDLIGENPQVVTALIQREGTASTESAGKQARTGGGRKKGRAA